MTAYTTCDASLHSAGKNVLTVAFASGKTTTVAPVPMQRLPSQDPADWLAFFQRHVPGSDMSEAEQNRVQAFLRKHGTDALTDGQNNFTLAGSMLAICDPAAFQ